MTAIRVLQVVTLMNRGGLESMLMNYYRNIDRNKIQFDFLEHRDGNHDYTEEILSLGGKIYHVPNVNPFNTNNYLNELNDFFKKHSSEYTIVHSHLDSMSAYPLKYAQKYGIPVRIAHSHNTNQEKNLKYLVKMYSKTKIKKFTTNQFACGKEAGQWLFSSNDFQIMNNAIDTEKYIYNSISSLQMKKSLNISGKFVLAHIGRFNKQKNHDFLIDIFKEVYKNDNNSILLLVGVGELEGKVKDKVKRLGLTKVVKFLGLRNDIPDLLQAVDVFVFPSLFEGLPVTLVEAQASGLPCIVSENITDEVKLTENIKYLNLRDDVSIWAKYILKYKYEFIRKNMYKTIAMKDFDIVKNASKIEDFYIKSSR